MAQCDVSVLISQQGAFPEGRGHLRKSIKKKKKEQGSGWEECRTALHFTVSWIALSRGAAAGLVTPLRGLTPARPGLLQPSASSQRDSPRLLLRAFGHVVLWSDVSRVRCVTGSTVVTTCSFVPVDDDRPWGPAGLREHLPECRLPSQHPHPKLLPPRGHLPPSSVPSWPSECSGRLPASSWHTGMFPLPHAVLPRAQRTAVRGLCVHTPAHGPRPLLGGF